VEIDGTRPNAVTAGSGYDGATVSMQKRSQHHDGEAIFYGERFGHGSH
jgi:hypothetical protein